MFPVSRGMQMSRKWSTDLVFVRTYIQAARGSVVLSCSFKDVCVFKERGGVFKIRTVCDDSDCLFPYEGQDMYGIRGTPDGVEVKKVRMYL